MSGKAHDFACRRRLRDEDGSSRGPVDKLEPRACMPFMRGFPLWRFVFQLCNSGLALPGSLEPPTPSTNSRYAINAVSHSECPLLPSRLRVPTRQHYDESTWGLVSASHFERCVKVMMLQTPSPLSSSRTARYLIRCPTVSSLRSNSAIPGSVVDGGSPSVCESVE